ncbi:MAG: hypothetical protein ABFD80_12975, partial [Acidobacteriota bacterium]
CSKARDLVDEAAADIRKLKKDIEADNALIAKLEDIQVRAKRAGNVQAESEAERQLLKVREAKKKNEASQERAAARRSLAEKNLKDLCGRARDIRQRLASGVPVQLEAIKKTEAQLNAAKADRLEGFAEMGDVVRSQILDYAYDYISTAKALRAQVEMLKDAGLDKKKREILIHSVQTVIQWGEATVAAYQAGRDLKTDMRKATDYLAEANRIFVESGIAAEAGDKLSTAVGGPFGNALFRGAELAIELGCATAKAGLGQRDTAEAEKYLDIMRAQHRRVEDMIAEIDEKLEGCCRE